MTLIKYEAPIKLFAATPVNQLLQSTLTISAWWKIQQHWHANLKPNECKFSILDSSLTHWLLNRPKPAKRRPQTCTTCDIIIFHARRCFWYSADRVGKCLTNNKLMENFWRFGEAHTYWPVAISHWHLAFKTDVEPSDAWSWKLA